MTAEQWSGDIDVNLTGAFRVVQACLPGCGERGCGRIVADLERRGPKRAARARSPTRPRRPG